MYRCGLGGVESENVHGVRARSKIKTGLRTPRGPATERAGVVFRSLLRHVAPFGGIWGSLEGYFCVHEGLFGKVLVCFRKIFIFPIDFNDFMQLWGELVATLLALGGHFWVTWGICG